MTWRGVRIALLLAVLGMVALDAYLTRVRTTSWEHTLRVSLYPIVADGRPATREYVAKLTGEDFAGIEAFAREQATQHDTAMPEPLKIWLRPPLEQAPPLPPRERGLLGTMLWSLKLRWWASRRESAQPSPRGHAKIFVLYYDPASTPAVAHSLGLKEGLIGIVHAFASRAQAPTNNVVIAHEVLHTLGATDKYDPVTGAPRYPEGYADPEASPRHPQEYAEIMGGRIPLAPGRAEIPASLDQVVVGAVTAAEIGWSATR